MPRLKQLQPRVATVADLSRVRTPDGKDRKRFIERGSASERGYDRDWQKLRYDFLMENPFCQCEDHKDLPVEQRPLADTVDHIIPIAERPDLRLVWDNLRSMTESCHNRHTARTMGRGIRNR